MNSYEMTWKRNVGMMKWRKATGQVFSPELEAHFEEMCHQVAEAERRRELKMKIWGAINVVTFGLVGLPTDEAPLQLPEEMKDEVYRKNEAGYNQLDLDSLAHPFRRVLRSSTNHAQQPERAMAAGTTALPSIRRKRSPSDSAQEGSRTQKKARKSASTKSTDKKFNK
eukprot:gene10958-12784_t